MLVGELASAGVDTNKLFYDGVEVIANSTVLDMKRLPRRFGRPIWGRKAQLWERFSFAHEERLKGVVLRDQLELHTHRRLKQILVWPLFLLKSKT